jgi:PAS domain S-box-containing protein
MDERLVSVRGTLIETLTRTNSTRLTLQAENTVFEAVLSHSAADRDVLDLTPDMGLELTGIYGIDFDDSRHARGFQLRLRSPEDVTIYRKPPAWTIQRAFAVSVILGGFTILGIAWVTALRRRVNRQTEQIRSQLEKEVAFQERHRGIVEHASDFIFTTDLEGNFTSFNTAGERMTGIPRKKAQQMNIRELLNKDGADKLLNAGSLPQDDGVITFQSRLRSRNKGLIWTETNARLLRDGDRPVEILGIVRDISERKQIEGELQRARDAAEATTKAKGEFLANMSHEIRTPMNAVIGMSNLLMDTGLNEHQKDYAQTIRNGAESLLTVLNDILDFSKIEAGQLHFEHLDFDLRETIKGVIELLSPKAIAKHLDLRSEIPHSVPCKLRGDPSRLRQVLMNLVGNAIKFTEVGEVSVSVALESESDTGVRLLFDVTDTGIGIPLEAQPRLFRPFSQADGSTTRKFGGTGLGLAISKQIVELMGGSCAVRSKPGEGATFWFNAPFAKQTAATKSDGKDSERPAQNSQPVRSLHVLLAEDNLVNQRVAALQLKKLGHQIDTASNGIEVLNALQSKSYDVIIMDCQMPEMDGYEAARQIREGSIANRIPIIALTANAMQGDREKCIEAGMDDYLSKPMRLPDLQDALRRCANKTTGSGTSPNDVSGGDPAKVHARGPDQS